jgi:hypothetical protein
MSDTRPPHPHDEVDSVRDVLRALRRESAPESSRRATLAALGISSDVQGVARAGQRSRVLPVLARWVVAGMVIGFLIAGALRWLER